MEKENKQQSRPRSKAQTDAASRKNLRIYYAPDETGPAELLGEKLARIIEVPIGTQDFWRGDIVRLTHLPGDETGAPKVAEVVATRHDQRSHVLYHGSDRIASTLMTLFSILEADSAVIASPDKEMPGLLSVAHDSWLDPVAVVKLLRADEPLP